MPPSTTTFANTVSCLELRKFRKLFKRIENYIRKYLQYSVLSILHSPFANDVLKRSPFGFLPSLSSLLEGDCDYRAKLPKKQNCHSSRLQPFFCKAGKWLLHIFERRAQEALQAALPPLQLLVFLPGKRFCMFSPRKCQGKDPSRKNLLKNIRLHIIAAIMHIHCRYNRVFSFHGFEANFEVSWKICKNCSSKSSKRAP